MFKVGFMKVKVQLLLLFSPSSLLAQHLICESEGSSGGENSHFPFLPQHRSCCSCAGGLSQTGKKAKTRTDVIVSHCSVFITLTNSRLGLVCKHRT